MGVAAMAEVRVAAVEVMEEAGVLHMKEDPVHLPVVVLLTEEDLIHHMVAALPMEEDLIHHPAAAGVHLLPGVEEVREGDVQEDKLNRPYDTFI